MCSNAVRTSNSSVSNICNYQKIIELEITILIILNEEMDDTMKIFYFFETSGSLLKGFIETIENQAK